MALLQLGQIDVLGNNGHDGTMTDGRPLGPRALSGKEHEFQLCLPLSTKASAVSIFLLSLSLFLNICHNRLGQGLANSFWVVPDGQYVWLYGQSLLCLLTSALGE